MKTELHEVILAWVKDYVRSLSDNDFLALTCNMRQLFCGLVSIIREESSRRNINPTSNTARTFDRSRLGMLLKKAGYTQKCLSGKARGWLVRERGLKEVNANRNINARP